jgi:hypothetical protein
LTSRSLLDLTEVVGIDFGSHQESLAFDDGQPLVDRQLGTDHGLHQGSTLTRLFDPLRVAERIGPAAVLEGHAGCGPRTCHILRRTSLAHSGRPYFEVSDEDFAQCFRQLVGLVVDYLEYLTNAHEVEESHGWRLR